MRTEVILPSTISKNRVFMPYLNKIKRIFNFCGFSYRSNKWYIDKINNIFIFINMRSILIFLFLIIAFFIYIKFFFNEYSFSFFVLWKSIEIFEDFFTSIFIYLYCFIFSLKIYTWRIIFSKNIINKNRTTEDKSYYIKNYDDSELSNNFKIKINSDKLILIKYLYQAGSFSFDNGSMSRPKMINDFFINNSNFNKFNSNFGYTNYLISLRYLYFNKNKNNSIFNNIRYLFSFYNLNLDFQNFKNLKLNQWFSKYNGLNSTSYNYFYGVNDKFSHIGNNFKLFNINLEESQFFLNNNETINLFLKSTGNNFFKYYMDYISFMCTSNSWIFNKINLFQLVIENLNFKNISKKNIDSELEEFDLFVKRFNFFLNFKSTWNFTYFHNFNFYNIKLNSNFNKNDELKKPDLLYIKKIFFFKK